ncbi:MAG: phytanoyl-CoA dioxygenase family protein [Candidatus Latescibacterota bacterium]|nr:phytanoyl-CoA dioxygenase family protein [Candidatus Latescibacterota bacterium]
MISSNQIEQFYRQGAVTIDTPLAAEQLQAAGTALDRMLSQTDPPRRRASQTCSYFDEELLEIIVHPFFEEVAKAVLFSRAVRLLQTAIVTSFPETGAKFEFDQHIDMQYSWEDLHDRPSRAVCSFFLWLTDVTLDSAPLMYRPGSHLPLIEEWGRRSELSGQIPRVIGIKLEELPDFSTAEAQPLLARAGQATVLTTAMIHGASTLTGDQERKVFVLTFHDAGVTIGLPEQQRATKQNYDRILRQRVPADRVHLITDHDTGDCP